MSSVGKLHMNESSLVIVTAVAMNFSVWLILLVAVFTVFIQIALLFIIAVPTSSLARSMRKSLIRSDSMTFGFVAISSIALSIGLQLSLAGDRTLQDYVSIALIGYIFSSATHILLMDRTRMGFTLLPVALSSQVLILSLLKHFLGLSEITLGIIGVTFVTILTGLMLFAIVGGGGGGGGNNESDHDHSQV